MIEGQYRWLQWLVQTTRRRVLVQAWQETRSIKVMIGNTTCKWNFSCRSLLRYKLIKQPSPRSSCNIFYLYIHAFHNARINDHWTPPVLTNWKASLLETHKHFMHTYNIHKHLLQICRRCLDDNICLLSIKQPGRKTQDAKGLSEMLSVSGIKVEFASKFWRRWTSSCDETSCRFWSIFCFKNLTVFCLTTVEWEKVVADGGGGGGG